MTVGSACGCRAVRGAGVMGVSTRTDRRTGAWGRGGELTGLPAVEGPAGSVRGRSGEWNARGGGKPCEVIVCAALSVSVLRLVRKASRAHRSSGGTCLFAPGWLEGCEGSAGAAAACFLNAAARLSPQWYGCRPWWRGSAPTFGYRSRHPHSVSRHFFRRAPHLMTHPLVHVPPPHRPP